MCKTEAVLEVYPLGAGDRYGKLAFIMAILQLPRSTAAKV